mgnify:CR=1 FL=1
MKQQTNTDIQNNIQTVLFEAGGVIEKSNIKSNNQQQTNIPQSEI